jgi:hypothetical protein
MRLFDGVGKYGPLDLVSNGRGHVTRNASDRPTSLIPRRA